MMPDTIPVTCAVCAYRYVVVVAPAPTSVESLVFFQLTYVCRKCKGESTSNATTE